MNEHDPQPTTDAARTRRDDAANRRRDDARPSNGATKPPRAEAPTRPAVSQADGEA
jgi:hypothetical protein